VSSGAHVVSTCARCGESFRQRGTGRPRKFCLECKPSQWDRHKAAGDEEWMETKRRRAREHAAYLAQLKGRVPGRDRRPDEACTCGRDYLTVPTSHWYDPCPAHPSRDRRP